jgi:nitrile hydratase subunit beta
MRSFCVARTETAAFSGAPGRGESAGREPVFKTGDAVRISMRFPIGHFRVPTYIRGSMFELNPQSNLSPLTNRVEGHGRNTGSKRHYYHVASPFKELSPHGGGSGTTVCAVKYCDRKSEYGQSIGLTVSCRPLAGHGSQRLPANKITSPCH